MLDFPIKARGRLHAIGDSKYDTTTIVVCFLPHNSLHTCRLSNRGLTEVLLNNREYDFLIDGLSNSQLQVSFDTGQHHQSCQESQRVEDAGANQHDHHCSALIENNRATLIKRKRPFFA